MSTSQKATFGAGCFWGVEETFRALDGVISTRVGYLGGKTENPTYQDVCTDETGHAEVVEVVFDPTRIAYEKLLEVFWAAHNPTELNRQGPDVGAQYRSAIFYQDDEQRRIAEVSKAKLIASGRFKRPVVTEITPTQRFWPAEEYHQQYLKKRGLSNCHI